MDNKTRQSGITVIVVMVLFVAGCQNQHAKYKQAATQRWDNTRVQLAIAIAARQFREGQLDKAAKSIHDALEINPDHAAAHLLLGRVYMEQNRQAMAYEAFRRCLEINPDDAEANYNLGILYELSKDFGQAMTHYRKAFSLEERNTAYLLGVADILVIQNQHKQALDFLTERITSGQYEPSVYLACGNILTAMGRTGESVSMFRRALNLSPDNPDITESLAFALLADGNVNEARALLKQLISRAVDRAEPVRLSWNLALGDCYLLLGRFHKAQQCFEQVRDMDRFNPAIWIRLAQTAVGRNDIARAKEYMERALQLDPDDKMVRKLMKSVTKNQTIANMPSVLKN